MIKNIAILGSSGFVGTALKIFFSNCSKYNLTCITRQNYDGHIGQEFDVLIDTSGNSKKFVADKDSLGEFHESVLKKIKIIHDFKSKLHVHISSVDVYPNIEDIEFTNEKSLIDISNKKLSNYGFHKFLAENITKFYCKNYIIFRLSGMVGENLKKNPVYDILNSKEIFIHKDSKYQFINTAEVAKIISSLLDEKFYNDVFNISGNGLISPSEIASIADKELKINHEASEVPRVVNIDNSKVNSILKISSTKSTIKKFIKSYSNQQNPQ